MSANPDPKAPSGSPAHSSPAPSRRGGRVVLVLLAVVALVMFGPRLEDLLAGGDGQAALEPVAAADEDGGSDPADSPDDATIPWYESIPDNVPVVDFRNDPDDPSSNSRFLEARDEFYRLIDDFVPEVYVIGLNPSWSFFDPSQFWLEGFTNATVFSYDPDDEYNSTQHGIVGLSYNCTPEERDAMQAQVDAATQEILACIPADADDWTAALTVYNELVRRVTYDPQVKAGTGEGSLHCQDIYGALVEHNAVCMGYAYAFDHICGLAGVACNLVLSDDGSHIYSAFAERWDDGTWHWCFVDPTWGDLDAADVNGNAYVDHSYFGVSEEEIERYESHDVRMSAFIGYDDSLNWYVRTGALLADAGYGSMRDVFARQYTGGANYLEVRFTTDEAYRQACDSLFADGNATLNALLQEIGYFGQYRYWYNDTARTVGVGLNAPAV